jgi:hypothetical protein
MVREGVPVTDLAAQLGHARKSMTLDTYSHVLRIAAIPANRLPSSALAELLSRQQGLERPCEVLVAWARGA